MVRLRRHHNNLGTRQIKRGKTELQLRKIARRLKIKYLKGGKKDGPIERSDQQ